MGEPKVILLTQGQHALVSEIDYDFANQWSWYHHHGYAKRTSEGIYLHIEVARRAGLIGLIDHEDRDTLNCQRWNLRQASRLQNGANKKLSKANTSGYKGVVWNKRLERWIAEIRFDGNKRHLGVFTCKHDAARAYNNAAFRLFGKFAAINMIEEDFIG